MSDDYEVGYKKPPKTSQFKTGQSGNPKGRPKGVQNLSTDLQEEPLEEWNTGHLASAQHIPLQNISEGLMSLSIDKNRTVYLYCRSGNRSGKAKIIMQQLGYSNVINAGGMRDASILLQDSIIGR